MRLAGFKFKPGLIPTLLTLILLPVLVALGFWQLARMEEKQLLEQQRLEKTTMPALNITGRERAINDVAFRVLTAKGRFVPEYTVYIDNKVHNGKVGFEIVMPFRLQKSDVAVLVNRGWIQATNSRQNLPKFKTAQADIEITGIAQVDTQDVANLGSANRVDDGWPALVRWVDIGALQKDIPYHLKNFLLLQQSDSGDGLVRQWKFVSSPPEKNLSYAVQWFSLAAALLIIYIVVNTRRISIK